MKEKLRYVLTSGFARVAAQVIFVLCTILMLIRRSRKKRLRIEQNENQK